MQDAQLLTKIDEFIAQNQAQLVKDLADLIAIRSVEGEAAGEYAPFGAEVRAALDTALTIAQRMGLATGEDGGYVGWAQVPGKRPEYIATVTHLDVVPEGEGWSQNPYTLTEKDGWLMGRGTEDDKGPSILCLYAAKFIQEYFGTPEYTLRVLLGCNEETGMGDMPHYLATNEEPLFAFSPDTDFPVCNGEKGHFGGQLVSAELDGNIIDIAGGYASNVIPDRATALVKGSAESLQNTEYVTVAQEEEGHIRLNATGIGGHAAHPEGTVNAIGKLVDYLLDNGLCTEEENRYLSLLQKLHTCPYGSGLGVDATDPVFSPLTIIGGIIKKEGGTISQDMDSRFVPSTSVEKMQGILDKLTAQHGATLSLGRCAEPFYLPADIAPVKALMESYNEVTGKQAKTYTMGGGTYARKFKSAVSFGPHDPDEVAPDFIGAIHGANEGVSMEGMLKALKVYILSLVRLQEIEY